MGKIPKVTHHPNVILIVLIESVVLILGVVRLAVNVPQENSVMQDNVTHNHKIGLNLLKQGLQQEE